MVKLDNRNRLTISKKLMKVVETNFNDTLMLYANGKEFFVDNPSDKYSSKYCLGIIKLDSIGRFYVPKVVRNMFSLKPHQCLACYVHNNKITFRHLVSSNINW